MFADKYSAADRKYNEALEAYQKEQAEYDQEYETAYKQEQLRYTRIAAHMGAGLIDDVVAYFHYVLCADIFNLGGVPFKKGFKRSWFYYAKEKELSFYYRIPTLDDLSLVQCYTYDERGDLLVPHQYPKAELQKHALDIASSILLRAIAVVFKSDPYDVVRKIDLIGYLEYLDESCGQMKQKDVFRAVVNKEQFNELDLEYVNPKMFFERKAKAEYADGLYLSENIDLAGLEVSHRED